MAQLDALKNVLRKSWSLETCYPDDKGRWSTQLPAVGQCAVTSLIVNDILGGKIAYNRKYKHYWNILDNGDVVDLTKEQFPSTDFEIDGFASRKYLLESERAIQANTLNRYLVLKQRVDKLLLIELVK